MPALSFQKQFADQVATGKKRQTIRAWRKRPFFTGDKLYLYTGLRTSSCRKLGEAVAARVVAIVIGTGKCGDEIDVAGRRLNTRPRADCATAGSGTRCPRWDEPRINANQREGRNERTMRKRRVTKRRPMDTVDLFCGLGGSSQGAEESGHARTVLAVNHWRPAAYAFGANHPKARVICARIDDIDPRNDKSIPEIDLLLASPECTHHSIARGGQPVEDQKRSGPFDVCKWIDAKRPMWAVVENVREFRDWGPLVQKRDKDGRLLCDKRGRPWMVADPKRKGETFTQWIRMVQSLGYKVDHQILCAADFGAPTSRERLFMIAMREDLRLKDIPWPEPTHSRKQWVPAASIIDWSIPCPSIFSRKRPLVDKTLGRLESGLRRFVGQVAEPFIVKLYGSSTTASVRDPLHTVTAQSGHLALAQPFLVQYHGGTDPRRNGTERQYAIDRPLPTIDTNPRYALAAPFILDVNHGDDHRTGQRCYSLGQPLGTVTTSRGKGLCVPFLTKYYGTGGVAPIDEPLDTITTKSRFGLAMVSLVETMRQLGVVDIGFRMLTNYELLLAQGFPQGYLLDGARTEAERTKLIGNAVPPPFTRAICTALAEAA